MLELDVSKQRGAFGASVRFTSTTPGVTALFGRSGCGKTTTVHMIAGLLRPDRGHIRIDDTILFDHARGIDVPAEERAIGYVFQDARLFPHLTVRDNLRYGERRARARARTLQFDAVVGLLGLAPLLSRRPAGLSGGERQRVAIGRALLAQPRLLLLDEPLASIDVARRGELLPYLENLRDQFRLPMVFVSHQFEEVLRLAGDVVVLDDGKVAAHGDVIAMSQAPALRAIIGTESLGAVVEGIAGEVDAASGLVQIRVGDGQLLVEAAELDRGQRVRVQLLARDLILAIAPPHGLSVRNSLTAVITRVEPDGERAWMVFTDTGGAALMVRVTEDARRALGLAVGQPVWVLVKAVSMRGHVFSGPGPPSPP
ncbi:MAG TPA: molybdenum ABC transporter ATP-binding protein [Steroidobacteraceae bacterium]|jgi:molybdate transport system ATP-binding protein|nr:molybdenum ABC transporter ATP-binding protein [Steroidobacteraceae bacterium]